MRYRTFPKIPGLDVSTLGFGCMRLPTTGGDPGRIDEIVATRLLHEAIDAGVTYLDTSFTYHQGQSEPFLGHALAGGLRDKVQIATKSPVWLVKDEGDWERLLDVQLERLKTDHLDFYLMPALTRDRLEFVERLHGLEALERARQSGRVGHLGFSYHGDSLEEFKRIVDAHDWALCQISLDLLDQNAASLRRLHYASDRDIGAVVMEPLRGGVLAKVPPVVAEAWSGSERTWSPAEWALRWVWDRTGVVTSLSGVRSSEHLRENASAASEAGPLTEDDLERIEEVRRTYGTRRRVPCMSCGGCGVCAHQIPISTIFALYNDAMFESKSAAVAEYRHDFLERGLGADECEACGTCEFICPRKIPIPDKLREAHGYLTSARRGAATAKA
jgi:uncharacterized protein